MLLDALCGSNEAPLKRRVMDAGLADDFQAMLLDGMLQPQAMFQLKGTREGAAEKFRALLEETCAELAEKGIPRDKLSAALAQAEFNLREGDWGGYPDGVALSMCVMSSWLYDDERRSTTSTTRTPSPRSRTAWTRASSSRFCASWCARTRTRPRSTSCPSRGATPQRRRPSSRRAAPPWATGSSPA